jgi:ubiquinone biosynthesis UbiH/UbiF/VisC/COQ6 family hydroxylase
VLAPARVASVAFEASCARVTLEDGRVLTAPLVVGAEGRSSVVRAAAKINAIGWAYAQTGVVATVKLSRPHEGVAHEYFLPGGPFAILPLTDDRASLVWTEPAAKAAALKAARPEIFHAHLRRRFGAFLGEATVEGPVFTYPLSLQLAERLCAPRAALLGDAAHGIHPIAGQGLNLGLKGAAALAEVLVDAARLGEDIGSELVLERYARWRSFDNITLAAASDLFVRLFSNDNPLLRLVRGGRHVDGQPHRPRPPLLHARRGRSLRRPAPAAAGRGALARSSRHGRHGRSPGPHPPGASRKLVGAGSAKNRPPGALASPNRPRTARQTRICQLPGATALAIQRP